MRVRCPLTICIKLKNLLTHIPVEQFNFSWIRVQECNLCNCIHFQYIIYITRSVNYTNNRGTGPLHSIPFIEFERYRFSTPASTDIKPSCSGSFSNSLISCIKHTFEYQLLEITTGQKRHKEKKIRRLT